MTNGFLLDEQELMRIRALLSRIDKVLHDVDSFEGLACHAELHEVAHMISDNQIRWLVPRVLT